MTNVSRRRSTADPKQNSADIFQQPAGISRQMAPVSDIFEHNKPTSNRYFLSHGTWMKHFLLLWGLVIYI